MVTRTSAQVGFRARDNARPAAAEWGILGSPRSGRVGFGA